MPHDAKESTEQLSDADVVRAVRRVAKEMRGRPPQKNRTVQRYATILLDLTRNYDQ